MSAIAVCEKLPIAPVAGSMKKTSEPPTQKHPSAASWPRTMAAKSVISEWTRHPARVIGDDAPPIGNVPTPTGTPAAIPARIWSIWIRAKCTGRGVTRCRK